ncbi:MAG: SCP2 sterol-binding domain-containing protein, partial [Gammaproteobacteria bacterium]|nr:SCP2 sterol-binding domain-containing protein [Gammaproteobacteria bacterium]
MRAFFEKKIQLLLNRFLALDPESSTRLRALENHSITIELKGIDWIFQLLFANGKILVQTENLTKSDTVIKGTPLSLLSMALTTNARQTFFSDDVSIEGNIEIGQQVIELFDALEWDCEEDLSRLTGDIPAHQIGRAVRHVKQF